MNSQVSISVAAVLLTGVAFLGARELQAQLVPPGENGGNTIIRQSHVDATVTPESGGVYWYQYTLFNDSPGAQPPDDAVWPAIIGYEIPLDHPDVIWDIFSPDTWSYRFFSAAEYELMYGTPNPFNSAYVLQWYDAQFFEVEKMIVPSGYNETFEQDHYEPYAEGFSFRSYLSPEDGPYAAVWFDLYRFIGDPPLLGSGISGGGLPYNPIPEMPSQGLAAIACLGLASVAAWRRAKG